MLLVLRFKLIALAGVAELVDALDLGSSDASRGGSSPSARTKRFRRLQDDNRRTFCGGDPGGTVGRIHWRKPLAGAPPD